MSRVLRRRRWVWGAVLCLAIAGGGVAVGTIAAGGMRGFDRGADFVEELDRLLLLAEKSYRDEREFRDVAKGSGLGLEKALAGDWAAWYRLRAYVESAPPGTAGTLVGEFIRSTGAEEAVLEGPWMFAWENWYWEILVRNLSSGAPAVYEHGRRWTVAELSADVLFGYEWPWLEEFLRVRGIEKSALRERIDGQLAEDLQRQYLLGGPTPAQRERGRARLVKELWAGRGVIEIGPLVAVGRRVYFVKEEACWTGEGDARCGPAELWVSDATENTTALLRRAATGLGPVGRISSLVAAGGRVFFLCEYGCSEDGSEELWVTDGSPDGTLLLVGRAGEDGVSSDVWVEEVGERVAFARGVVAGGERRAELWISDGTRAGTARALELGPGGWLMRYASLGGRMFFAARDDERGRCLGVSDGATGATSIILSERESGGQKSPVEFLAVAGSRLYFVGYHRSFGKELWVTDGTETGTGMVRDIAPGRKSSDPVSGMDLDGTLLFIPSYPDSPGGFELWASGGDAASTFLLAELLPAEVVDHPITLGDASFSRAGKRALIAVKGQGKSWLWATDGTREGTSLVAELTGCYLGWDPLELGDGAFFVTMDADHGQELWWTDGTRARTRLVRDIRPGPEEPVLGDFHIAGGRLFFTANDGTHGFELWVSDGTSEGTRMVKDIVPGIRGGNPRIRLAVGDRVVFCADHPRYGRELWVSDGTEMGTSLVADIVPGSLGPKSIGLVQTGDLLFVSSEAPYGAPLAWIWILELPGR